MARIQITTCDGCGTTAPDNYIAGVFAVTHGWYSFRRLDRDGDHDVCSDRCLLVLAQRLNGIESDPLEVLFTSPAATKRQPRRKGGTA